MTIKDWKELIEEREVQATSLDRLYNMWLQFYFSRIVRIFRYNNLPFPQHELEGSAIINGISFVAWHNKDIGLVTRQGSIYGVTRYPDVYTHVIYAMPSEKGGSISGRRKIGIDACVLYNTATSMSMLPFLQRYASLSAHADLTFKCALIGLRYSDILVSSDDEASESLQEYYEQKYKGNPAMIIDESMLINPQGMINLAEHNKSMDLRALQDVQNELQRSFYRDIGIRWVKEKRANIVTDEVEGNDTMLLFNIADMFYQRQLFVDEFNRLFKSRLGMSISVSISPEFQFEGSELNVK